MTIIVVAHPEWLRTRACLTAVRIAGLSADVHYEVVLAGLIASDEVARAAANFPGLIVATAYGGGERLSTPEEAASRARGRYLIFLDGATVVLPGWLKSLVHTADEDTSIAVAGSKNPSLGTERFARPVS